MSMKNKQSLGPRPQIPATPRRAPSTPHAIRALLQRSGGRRKSANTNRPDSARNILRQLARIAAPQTIPRASTLQPKGSALADKENVSSPYTAQGDKDLENGEGLERPEFTLPIDETDEGDGAGMAPTRQELPGGEDYTFKSIDFAAHHRGTPTSVRSEGGGRISRMSILPFRDEEASEGFGDEGDSTVQSVEYGRRATSEGPAWERFPRSSFGSIRMSEFGVEESRLEKDPRRGKSLIFEEHRAESDAALSNDFELDEGETEDLRQFRNSISEPLDDGLFVQDPGILDDDNTFRLDFHQHEPATEISDPSPGAQDSGSEEMVNTMASEAFQQPSHPDPSSQASTSRPMSKHEAAAPGGGCRRKKLRLTTKGNTVPTLPSSLIKRVAIDSMTRPGKRRPTIARDSLVALEQATEWFFEQVGEDLEAYSDHAKRRKRIEDADVVALMKRQRMIGRGQGIEDLAQELLPEEALIDLHLPDMG